MNNGSNINFTSADIEKYHRGLLSPAEMHAMEKAALEDPFLADALEGYALPGVDADADLSDLRQRLTARTSQARVISLAPAERRNFSWLKIAAMVIAIAGAGLVVYQLGFNQKQTPEIAQQPTAPTEKIADSNPPASNPGASTPATAESTVTGLTADTARTLPNSNNNAPVADLVTIVPAKPAEQTEKKEVKLKALAAPSDSLVINTDIAQFKEGRPSLAETGRADRPAKTNVFRGRVTDASNNPLPFANITNTADNIGTYSDAKGYFTLISPDSVLDVQVRSLGFVYSRTRLQADKTNNQVVLQDDRDRMSEIVVSKKKTGSRSRDAHLKLEEPEPADGWTNYDTYLANNLNVPETYKGKQNSGGEVELSFEVNQQGEPVNIAVVRSLCETCDREAIRLLREGPRWKSKSKSGKTSITISF